MTNIEQSTRPDEWKELIKQAIEARKNAYAPYSHYKVGAALLTRSGKIYRGCNIENAAYTPSVCAERTAVFKAVSEGETEFVAIAVVTADGGAPCGVCRQVLREFAPHLTIIMADLEGRHQVLTLSDLLPHSFGPENLQNSSPASPGQPP
uniref:Cytidine deaminase n=1 Tax=uncultured Chloroflexota bacterium TaxID=166587 RepID=H5SPC7_9CHLR|nr:cytidine deaminase [uncultured Chloroflexota bacterium]